MLAREGNCEMIDEISEGRKRFHTASESDAERKFLEMKESLQASTGVVLESTAAMHPSGNSSKAVIFCSSLTKNRGGTWIFIYFFDK